MTDEEERTLARAAADGDDEAKAKLAASLDRRGVAQDEWPVVLDVVRRLSDHVFGSLGDDFERGSSEIAALLERSVNWLERLMRESPEFVWLAPGEPSDSDGSGPWRRPRKVEAPRWIYGVATEVRRPLGDRCLVTTRGWYLGGDGPFWRTWVHVFDRADRTSPPGAGLRALGHVTGAFGGPIIRARVNHLKTCAQPGRF